jgi:hypothetical protein
MQISDLQRLQEIRDALLQLEAAGLLADYRVTYGDLQFIRDLASGQRMLAPVRPQGGPPPQAGTEGEPGPRIRVTFEFHLPRTDGAPPTEAEITEWLRFELKDNGCMAGANPLGRSTVEPIFGTFQWEGVEPAPTEP